MKKIFYLALFSIFFSSLLFSQKGKDGIVTVGASTVVNVYTSLSSNASSGNTTINVANAAGFTTGDLLYIIQVQGASTNCYPEPINPNNGFPMSDDFGRITNYNNCGNNEHAQVSSVAGNVITIDCPLKNNYTAAGKVQVIRVARFAQLTVNSGGIITCPQWNGTTGGIIAIEVDGNTVINSGGKIDASGLGFRGGLVTVTGYTHAASTGANNWGHLFKTLGMYKGESIVGDTAVYQTMAAKFCKGAIGNGGGGGSEVNAGGGGGANAGDTSLWTGKGNPDNSVAGWTTAWNLEAAGFAASSSSGGGRGGYTYSGNGLNPTTVPPGPGNGWGGDNRRPVSCGLGGRPLDYTTGRLFIGGGGGSGDEDNAYGGAGGNGGGIITILSYGTISGAGTINSNGGNGSPTKTPATTFFTTLTGKDGAGGAGGGGAIRINSTGAISGISITASGGNGGNQEMRTASNSPDAYGPGGGGGGGYIGANTALPTTNVAGGSNGTVIYLSGINSCQIDNLFPPNGATKGGAGIATATLAALPTVTSTPSTTICVNNSATLSASTTGTGTVGWYTGTAGGTQLGTGSVFTTSVFTTPGTYTLFAGFCPDGIYRSNSVITVITGPTLTVNSPTICPGQTVTLTGTGATTYTWNTGPTNATIAVSPTTTTTYTVSGTVATCSATQTSTVTVTPAPTITAPPVSICTGQTATLTASGASSYTWNTGPTTASIAVSPTTTTSYTVTGSNGSCSSSKTTTVTVNSLPAVTSTSATICSGQTATLTAGGASTYTWNTGPVSSTLAVSPTITTNYTVTGNNGTCSNTQTTSVVVSPSPTVTITSATICAGQQATITAAGATTFTWNTGPITSSITVTPTTTTNYTVTGSNGSCTNTKTTSVIVNPNPTVTVNSATLCSGQTTTLIASGASTYTWNPGNLSGGTVTVSPSATQIYTVTATSSLSCQGSGSGTVTVTATPTLSIPSTTICSGNTATLVASGASSYTWNPGGATGTTFTAAPASNTIYTITGSIGSCSSTATASITIGSAISIAVNNPGICSGQTATLTASGASTYTWSTGSNSNSITVNPGATTIYTITGTSGSCNGSNTSTVTVNPTPTVSTGTLIGICSGQTATLTANGASTYTWNPGGLSGSSVTVSPTSSQGYTVIGSVSGCTNAAISNVSVTLTPTITAQPIVICPGGTGTLNASGASSYTWNPGNATGSTFTDNPSSTTNYTVTGANGACVSTATVDISIGSTLTVSINSPTICAGQSVTLTATGSATSYTWNTGANTNTIAITPATTTSYTVDVSSPGCTGTGTTTVSVIALPSVTVNGSAICSGQTVTLTASGATNYTWSPTVSTGATFTVTPSGNTTYSVIGETSGCSNTAIFNVTVTANPTLTVNSPTICNGSATLSATGAANYTWSPGGQTTSSIVVSPTITSTYTVQGEYGACNSSITTVVTVNPAPPMTIYMNGPVPFCAGSCNDFSVSAGYSSVVYDYGDATGTTTASVHCYSSSGAYTVTASGIYTSGCSTTSNTLVAVSFLPVNTATFDILQDSSKSVGVPVAFNSYSVQGNWNFGDGATLNNTADPTHSYNPAGNYCIKFVTPTNAVGCTDSLIKCIDIIQSVSIVIPNVFTPNGDNSNDTFKASGTGIATFHCVIVDRWGLRMYEWDGIGGGWDGYTKAGAQAPAGTYYYIITYQTVEGKSQLLKGYLTLFR